MEQQEDRTNFEVKSTDKYRNWFIEINPGAKVYNDWDKVMSELNIKHYSWICHDKDIYESGELKLKHYHIVLELKNATSFDSIKGKFEGAHIEVAKYKKRCYQYLIHKNNKEKHQYDPKNIITDDLDYLNIQLGGTEFELFDETKIIDYIVDGVVTYYRFLTRFGVKQGKEFWNSYNLLLKETSTDPELQHDIEDKKLERMDLPF